MHHLSVATVLVGVGAAHAMAESLRQILYRNEYFIGCDACWFGSVAFRC